MFVVHSPRTNQVLSPALDHTLQDLLEAFERFHSGTSDTYDIEVLHATGYIKSMLD